VEVVAVYVDDAHIPWRGRRWSHMVADLPEELHRAAEALGLLREWAQDKGSTLHYDLPDEVRARAIELGVARAISWRDLPKVIRGEPPTAGEAPGSTTP
jgi:hypothetical protein